MCTSATKLIYKPIKTDPHNPSSYMSIALMNCILKLWTSILNSIGTQTAESEGVFSDTADGFRSHINIYDSLSTHIMMYEDAKISKRNIYTAYSDFKGAFGGMDDRIQDTLPTYERIWIPRLLHYILQTAIYNL
jgi:hypothetical protein